MQRRTGFALTLGLALMAGLQSSARPAPPEGFLGSYHWTSPEAAFGGLSAIAVIDDGHILVLSDKGTLVEATVTRDATGIISGAKVQKIIALKDENGSVLTEKFSDSEGIDLAPDGSLIVSFEGKKAHVLRYDTWDGPARALPAPKSFGKFPRNAGFEAMTRDDHGTVFVIPEWSRTPRAAFRVYRLLDGTWDERFTLPHRGNFLPVSADFGPDGRLYVLERNFLGLMGFATRLRRFDVTEAGLAGEETLLETTAGVHDNLEGLSVWRDDQGELRATMVSDNNFQWFMRTDLVEYRLPD